MTRAVIDYETMTRAEMQAFAEYQLHELVRHVDDIVKIVGYLEKMAEKYGIHPTGKFSGKWIEI